MLSFLSSKTLIIVGYLNIKITGSVIQSVNQRFQIKGWKW